MLVSFDHRSVAEHHQEWLASVERHVGFEGKRRLKVTLRAG